MFGLNFGRMGSTGERVRRLLSALFPPGKLGAVLGGITITDGVATNNVFSDFGGTTPAVLEGTVANIFDATGNGQPALRATAGQRPVLTGRVNLLTYSENFSNADWFKADVTVSGNLLIATTANNTHGLDHNTNAKSGPQRFAIVARADALTKVGLREGLTSGAWAVFDLSAGTVMTSGNGAVTGISALGSGIYRCWIECDPGGNFGRKIALVPNSYTTGDPNGQPWVGDGTSGVFVQNSDCRYQSIPATLPAYQRVTTSTDYDMVGFPYQLKYDNVDDALTTTMTSAFDGEVWTNSPFGFYKSEYHGGASNVVTHNDTFTTGRIIRAGALTAPEKAQLASTFNTPEQYAVWTTSAATMSCTITGDVTLIGANGKTVVKTNPAGTITFATEGVTAPVTVIFPAARITDASMTTININSGNLYGNIPAVSGNTALTTITLNANKLTGAIPSLASNTALTAINVATNSLTGFAGSVSSTLATFDASANALTATAVNAVLAAFKAAGRTTGTITLTGGTNAAPTGQGITDKADLISLGLTVTTN